MTDWNAIVKEAVEAPCAHCGDSDVSYPLWQEHVSMPVRRPQYVAPYLEGLTGPNEQHTIDPGAHCENPKCGYYFTPADEAQIHQSGGEFTCPQCGWAQVVGGSQAPTYVHQNPDAWHQLQESGNLDVSHSRPANPGGRTNSGLTLKQMGDIGEAIVLRMGEIPGVGTLQQASGTYNFPIDVIVESQKGKFGCEIKTNHSQAQERFKIGGKAERAEKIKYCLANGLKPALIGVRLNFFTDRADIFFREGLTDTWVGNQRMIHAGTLDFSDLNPFKSPDPQAQAIAINNSHLPDQSEEGDGADADIDAIFGPEPTPVTAAKESKKRAFTIPHDVHDLKVVDHKGAHTHNIRRCHHCGVVYQRPSDHKGHFECPTCGKDVDSEPRLASRVVFGKPSGADAVAQELGWQLARRTGKGERVYVWTDPQGFAHDVTTGSGGHDKAASELDAMHVRQRMNRCMRDPWNCFHAKMKTMPQENRSVEAAHRAPVLRRGQVIEVDDREYIIQEIKRLDGLGTLVAVIDMQTGAPGTFTPEEIPPQKESAVEWS